MGQHVAPYGLFDRAEALAKQRRHILEAAEVAATAQGHGSPRKMRRAARQVEEVIVGIGELAITEARRDERGSA